MQPEAVRNVNTCYSPRKKADVQIEGNQSYRHLFMDSYQRNTCSCNKVELRHRPVSRNANYACTSFIKNFTPS
ncbi:hypothetical protein CHS0354_027538 [Potamilus streckersoni]|uniref:Uncharacterized protein n=1 Tax=Potamilus streckersoni TaxID=2493646 RepID=A0AAE0S1B7_9BIVA|nr:hypothetical protein CHS0354_027538 [Potamilus streckersoni]